VDREKHTTKKPLTTEQNNRLLEETLVNFMLNCKREGMKDSTIKTKHDRIKLVAKYGANILDPESVKDTIAKAKWMDSTKCEAVRDFSALYYFLKIQWKKPKYRPQEHIPFIPMEEELDTLISASNRLHAPPLQLLKESGIRIGEASQIKWIDVDLERKVIAINNPEKGSHARLCPISEKLRAMIGQLPRPNELLFRLKKQSLRTTFEAMRNRTAKKLGNPRLKKITFHTFRHWKGTTEYHKTKDILYVKTILGHKDIKSTMKYIRIENAYYMNIFDDEYITKGVTTPEEAMKLINTGFTKADEFDGIHIYRKRK
jgi:integrase